MELGCEEALLKFIAQVADVQQYEGAVKGMKGNGDSSGSERDPVELPETSSSSDLTESSSSSSEEEEGQQEEINAGENDNEEDGDEEDEDDSSEFDLSVYNSIEDDSSENDSSDDDSSEVDSSEDSSSEDDSSENDSSEDGYGQVPRKERHRYSSYNCYRDEPPVCLAARIGHVGIMKILLVHGADPNTQNWNLKTPLMIAARYGQTAIVTLLLNTGIISLNAHDDRQQCILSLAAQHGHTEVVKTLLARRI